jgi:hypothetical protein
MQMMMKDRLFKNNYSQIQKASNRSFEVIELYEDEPIVFQRGERNKKKQINANSKEENANEKKRKIMFVIQR